jgi:hypothetical protein
MLIEKNKKLPFNLILFGIVIVPISLHLRLPQNHMPPFTLQVPTEPLRL